MSTRLTPSTLASLSSNGRQLSLAKRKKLELRESKHSKRNEDKKSFTAEKLKRGRKISEIACRRRGKSRRRKRRQL